MLLYLNVSLVLILCMGGNTLRAVIKPHVGRGSEANQIWTNEALEALRRTSALISILGSTTTQKLP